MKCIKEIKTGGLYWVSNTDAAEWVAGGEYKYSTKGAYKRVSNETDRIRNRQSVQKRAAGASTMKSPDFTRGTTGMIARDFWKRRRAGNYGNS